MQVVDHYALFPGCCQICRSSRVPAVDTLMSNPIEERVYICEGCAEDIGTALGMTGRIASAQKEAIITGLQHEVEGLTAQLDQLQDLEKWVALTLQFGGTIGRDGKLTLRRAHPARDRPPRQE